MFLRNGPESGKASPSLILIQPLHLILLIPRITTRIRLHLQKEFEDACRIVQMNISTMHEQMYN